jgi:hypothetical protein
MPSIANGDSRIHVSKDVYDLSGFFFQRRMLQPLGKALKHSFTFRNDYREASKEIKALNTAILERGWPNAVASVPKAYLVLKEAFSPVIRHVADFEKSFHSTSLFFNALILTSMLVLQTPK